MVLFFFVSSVVVYAQDTTSITGLENIHLSEGAILVTQENDQELTVISAHSTQTIAITTQKEKEVGKGNVLAVSQKKGIKKTKQTIKKIKEAEINVSFIAVNSDSRNSFQAALLIQKIAIGHQYQTPNFMVQDREWEFVLHYYQTKEKTIYHFYPTDTVEYTLFGKSPPVIS